MPRLYEASSDAIPQSGGGPGVSLRRPVAAFLTHLPFDPFTHLLLPFGHWNLELGIYLEFVICDLEFLLYLSIARSDCMLLYSTMALR